MAKALVVCLKTESMKSEFGGNFAAVAELGLSLTCKGICMCPLTGDFSMEGISE